MQFLFGILFIIFALILIVLSSIAIINISLSLFGSAVGITRDGIDVGKMAPKWKLPDLSGKIKTTPSKISWQLLIFADRSLASFPSLVDGINYLGSTQPNLQVLILSRDSLDMNKAMVRAFDLQAVVIPVPREFYNKFRVQVMPFGFIVDPNGRIQWSGLLNTKDEVVNLWHNIYSPMNTELIFRNGEVMERI